MSKLGPIFGKAAARFLTRSVCSLAGAVATAGALGFPFSEFMNSGVVTQGLTALSFSASKGVAIQLGALAGGIVGWRLFNDMKSLKNSASSNILSKILNAGKCLICTTTATALGIAGALTATYYAATNLTLNGLADFNQRTVDRLYEFSAGLNFANLMDGTEQLLEETNEIILKGLENGAKLFENVDFSRDVLFQAVATPEVQAAAGIIGAAFAGAILPGKAIDLVSNGIGKLFPRNKAENNAAAYAPR